MNIVDNKLDINANGFLFGDAMNFVAEKLGDSLQTIADWDELIVTKSFEFAGHTFYSRLLFNETGLYCWMLEPQFTPEENCIRVLQNELDRQIQENKNLDIEYEVKYEIYPRQFGDFCITIMKRGFEWPA